ncbi:MAG: site-2 protease family protein [Archaeoglobus sp.]|jgi:membrane-associated protease RseP (regulator of RpoE activity)|nr:MAG: site-2 protease family protein [Archaeoglobus sp.]
MDIDSVVSAVQNNFKVYFVEKTEDGEGIRLYVLNPDINLLGVLSEKLGESGWEITLKEKLGEQYIEIRRKEKEKSRVWLNILLLILTFVTTTYVGMSFYPPNQNRLAGGIVFSTAILFVLGSHEMGHYFAARRWGVKTSLPYFIPAPTILGTFGAVITQKSNCPNRKALFDLGVSGPMVGVIASIIVTYIGLKMPAPNVVAHTHYIEIGEPPLYKIIEIIAHFSGKFMSPVAFAGWAGMLLTCLNMIPVGQLDGGHVLRAMIGRASDQVSKLMPIAVLGVGYLSDMYYGGGTIWIVWSLILLFFSFVPHPSPIDDETRIDKKRYALGIVAFGIALLCFTPAPFRLR